MKRMIGMLLCGAACLLSPSTYADVLLRCVDSSGKVDFVKGNCPPNNARYEYIVVNSPNPSGSSPATRMADPAILKDRPRVKLTVVESAPKPKAFSPPTQIQQEIEAQRAARAARMQNPDTRD